MSLQNTLFYKKNKKITYNFLAEEISSDGAVFLSEKVERKTKLIANFCQNLPDTRDGRRIEHALEKMVKQRVYLMIQGYEDFNDEKYLRNDPLIQEVLDGDLVSQPTMTRLENSLRVSDIYNISQNYFIDNYVASIPKNKQQIIIDADGTDDPTHGGQQLSMYNGYYRQFMYNELLFHDGESGQVIATLIVGLSF